MSSTPLDFCLDEAALANAGLNLWAVFPIDGLPVGARDALVAAGYDPHRYRQVLLFAHGGQALWRQLQAAGPAAADPIDTYSRTVVQQILDGALQGKRYEMLYPGSVGLDLQQWGALAGWHHSSPFWVGINRRFGSWFAYRALVLADSDFALTSAWGEPSPCAECEAKPCLGACPANALSTGTLNLPQCITYRRQPQSLCRYQCMARNACPVGAEHRYNHDQMRHHYAASLKFIEAMPH